MTQIDDKTRIELEAQVLRTLVAHLRKRTDVQNIDLMILSGFCRNCLGNWYKDAANERGIEMDKAEAREIIYGEPYADWKAKHQREVTVEQQKAYDMTKKPHG